ncbi:preprotein translocase subunit SecG [Pedobacter nutrimenti]|jgi:preprotein translocase subunit SecG|uniref:preprotein translocase subunit SecG n=1 Tax=Pedobacter nutrimenti TaxID=1241337 RepID=UPI00105ECEB5|nr:MULTISPECIES: preprotein translocase subunit SecG [Pedobacter]
MIFLIILLIIICIALGLFVLIQNPKGGGLATGGSGSNMFGVQRTGDVLEKGTWICLTLIVVISLTVTTIAKTGNTGSGPSKIQEQLDKTVAPSPLGQLPANNTQKPAPAPAPADQSKPAK